MAGLMDQLECVCGSTTLDRGPKSVVLHKHIDGEVIIVRAESYVEFANHILIEASTGYRKGVTYKLETDGHTHEYAEVGHAGHPCFNGALLHIYGTNQCVVYRIGDYLMCTNSWEGRWPD